MAVSEGEAVTQIAVAPWVVSDARSSGPDGAAGGRDGAGCGPLLPAPLATALASAEAALDTLLAADLGDLPGESMSSLVGALHRLSERAAAGVTTSLPRLEREGWWALGDRATFPRWAAARWGMSVPQAKRRHRIARVVTEHLPTTAAAARAGEVSTEAMAVLAGAATTDARQRVLADPQHVCNEQFLLGQAQSLGVDDLRAVVRVWADRADPEADERGYREASEREHLTLSRLPFGYRVDGQLTVEHGQQLGAALAAVTPVPAAADPRSAAQRRAQALSDLARTVLEHHPVGTGRVSRPRVSVHVDHETLRALVQGATASRGEGADAPFGPADLRRGAFFEDGTTVPRDVLDRLACDGELNRILFGPGSEVLDVGRAKRLFEGPRRAAVLARDGRCAYPGCTAPPHLCEVHHVDHWVRDHGETEPRKGVLLCYHHHEVAHRRGLQIRREADEWRFADRFGVPLRR